jgi:hypothetical protein
MSDKQADGTSAAPSVGQPAYGMWVIIAGLVAVVAVAVVAMLQYDEAADVVTVLGAVTGVIAALVGGYFGVRGATLAQQKANEASSQPGVPATDGQGGMVAKSHPTQG